MADIYRPADGALFDELHALRREVDQLRRLPSGTRSLGTEQLAPIPACSVYRTGVLDHTSTGNFQAVTWDFSAAHDTSAGVFWTAGTDLVLPVDGVWAASARVAWFASATGVRQLRIMVDGLPVDFDTITSPAAGNIEANGCAVSFAAAAGDIVTLEAYQSSGGDLGYWVGRQYMHLDLTWVSNS